MIITRKDQWLHIDLPVGDIYSERPTAKEAELRDHADAILAGGEHVSRYGSGQFIWRGTGLPWGALDYDPSKDVGHEHKDIVYVTRQDLVELGYHVPRNIAGLKISNPKPHEVPVYVRTYGGMGMCGADLIRDRNNLNGLNHDEEKVDDNFLGTEIMNRLVLGFSQAFHCNGNGNGAARRKKFEGQLTKARLIGIYLGCRPVDIVFGVSEEVHNSGVSKFEDLKSRVLSSYNFEKWRKGDPTIVAVTATEFPRLAERWFKEVLLPGENVRVIKIDPDTQYDRQGLEERVRDTVQHGMYYVPIILETTAQTEIPVADGRAQALVEVLETAASMEDKHIYPLSKIMESATCLVADRNSYEQARPLMEDMFRKIGERTLELKDVAPWRFQRKLQPGKYPQLDEVVELVAT